MNENLKALNSRIAQRNAREATMRVEDNYWDNHGNYIGNIVNDRMNHDDFRANDEGWD
jgi:hypothetical protein